MFSQEASCDTEYATIHMAGDIDHARQLIRKYVDCGSCFQLIPCDYVYTRGLEAGFTARVIAYPRFPKDAETLLKEAYFLGVSLGEELCQKSFSIETKARTHYFTHDKFKK